MAAHGKGYYLGTFRRTTAAVTGVLVRRSLRAEGEREGWKRKRAEANVF